MEEQVLKYITGRYEQSGWQFTALIQIINKFGDGARKTLNSLKNKGYGVQKSVCEFLLQHNKKLQFATLCKETYYFGNALPFDWGFIK